MPFVALKLFNIHHSSVLQRQESYVGTLNSLAVGSLQIASYSELVADSTKMLSHFLLAGPPPLL